MRANVRGGVLFHNFRVFFFNKRKAFERHELLAQEPFLVRPSIKIFQRALSFFSPPMEKFSGETPSFFVENSLVPRLKSRAASDEWPLSCVFISLRPLSPHRE